MTLLTSAICVHISTYFFSFGVTLVILTNVWFHIPDGNKQGHQLRKTISVEKKALYVCVYIQTHY